MLELQREAHQSRIALDGMHWPHMHGLAAGADMQPGVQSKYMPSPSYLKQVQTGLDAFSRATLVDYVINVHRKFKLVAPVLPLAVNLIDRFLTATQVKKDKLQLLGSAALLIASKFEEIYPPEVRVPWRSRATSCWREIPPS